MERLRSSISHGMRLPISIINGYADLLKNNLIKSEEEKINSVNKISENALLLNKVVIHSLMEITNNVRMPICIMEDFDLIKMMMRVIDSVEELLRRNNILIQFNSDDESIIYYGDETQITNVVNNLIENSIKYMKKSGFINITVSKVENQVIIAYKDNGQGIASDKINMIFDKKYRGSIDSAGSDMGLYFVKQIIKLHNGKVNAVSNINQGFGVYIYLPYENNKNIDGNDNLK